MTVGSIPLAPYATTGTAQVAASLRPFVLEADAILLENHGAVSYGKTLLDAFMKMETLEHLAHVALVAHQLGTARPLQDHQIQQLENARTKYLQNVRSEAIPRTLEQDQPRRTPIQPAEANVEPLMYERA